MRRTFPTILSLLLIAACVPSQTATTLDAEAALALAAAQDPLFAGIAPRDPGLIGQAAWSEVTETDAGWQVVFRIGWGDCPSGCIDEHVWTYKVAPTGEVTRIEETGSPLPRDSGITGTVVAGPTCPVVTDPPDPSCADQPVADAELVITTPDGSEVGRTMSDAAGNFGITLAPGTYWLVARPVEGLMGTPEPHEFSVVWGMPGPELVVAYDTGIR
ncbi:MAG TPA: carboxypeptidase-like regulatory domain-containing protein [Candidatus Limnocylindria bacterium]|nr:carboxypeptidase-like regulatory domain-containing protein [Candidatus Limnocylindria bacterium]